VYQTGKKKNTEENQ